ncbi:MAG TPA: hypothetical protein VGN88_06270 [Phycisphaerae bacterium]|jgi:hypothetical protein
MEDSIPDRYERNPMLVLAENYVLDAIGVLEAEKVKKLEEIVCRTFGGEDWREVLRGHFGLPGDSQAGLTALWKQRQAEAEMKQEDFTAEDFAREVADGMMEGMGG